MGNVTFRSNIDSTEFGYGTVHTMERTERVDRMIDSGFISVIDGSESGVAAVSIEKPTVGDSSPEEQAPVEAVTTEDTAAAEAADPVAPKPRTRK